MNPNKVFSQPVLIATIFIPLLVASTLVMAGTSDESGPERIQITDPDELERYGYSRDATNIWKLVHDEPLADRSGMTTEERAEERESILGSGALVRTTAYSGFEFYPLTDAITYVKGPSFLVQNGALSSFQDTPATFEVQLQLPQESTWDFLDIFGFHDAAGRELRITVLSRCQSSYFEAANPVETVLASITILDQGANFWEDVSVGAEVINNDLCSYHVRAVFWTDTTAPNVFMQLIKVRAQYDIPASLAPLIFQDRFEGS